MATTTKAAVCRATGKSLSIEDLELGEPQEDEVLVRVIATGVCHTDIGMRDAPDRVPKPIVLGHEGAGIVEKVGTAVRKVKPGDHVVMTFRSCGHCPNCRQGVTAYCDEIGTLNFAGQRSDGTTAFNDHGTAIHSHFFGQSSFATHAICSERNAIPVRQDVPLEILGPLGCGIQTGAGAILNSLKVTPGSDVGIFGVGSVGLAAVMAARLAGATTIIAVDTQRSRLDMATELGATHTIHAGHEDTFARIAAISKRGLNFAVDTTGNLNVIRQAAEGLAARGVCGLINTAKGGDASVNILKMVLGGRSIRGIHEGDSNPDFFIPQLIEFYAQGRFPFDRLIRFYDLASINAALDDMESGTTIKPVIRMPAAH
jgi:aryl-alcohol dehydrogenase